MATIKESNMEEEQPSWDGLRAQLKETVGILREDIKNFETTFRGEIDRAEESALRIAVQDLDRRLGRIETAVSQLVGQLTPKPEAPDPYDEGGD